MAEPSRYNVGGDESASEILKNKLGIKDQKALEDTESVLFSDTYQYFLAKLEADKLNFNVDIIFEIHKYFLDPLYSWAGKNRTVQISKDGVLFCKAVHIKAAMEDFEKLIKKQLPKKNDSKSSTAKKLAVIHCEFNAIHPFREGNGRTIRLFLDLLALANDYSLIDFGKSSKQTYIDACIAGMSQDYAKMKSVIYKGLKKK